MAKRANWYCVNKDCGSVLGSVVDNELVVKTESVLTVNTNNTALVVTCSYCGGTKVFYPSVESSVVGMVNSVRRDFIYTMSKNRQQ